MRNETGVGLGILSSWKGLDANFDFPFGLLTPGNRAVFAFIFSIAWDATASVWAVSFLGDGRNVQAVEPEEGVGQNTRLNGKCGQGME